MDARVPIGRWIAIWLLALGAPNCPAAGISHVGIQQWHSDHGLPQNSVQALCQTRDGYLWVGTRFGLARFDGVRFRTIGVEGEESSMGASISSLDEGPDGALWVGTLQGLMRYQQGRLERVRSVGEQRVWAVHAESAERVWLGLSGGLARLRKGKLESVEPIAGGESLRQIRGLSRFEDGALLVTTLSGVFRVEPDTGGIRVSADMGARFHEALGGAGTTGGRNEWGPRIRSDGSGAWWVLDWQRRLFHVDPEGSVRWSPATAGIQDEVLCVLRDREDNVWMGTAANGLFRFRRPLFELYALGRDDDAPVFAVSGDGSGVVWAAARTNLMRMEGGVTERFPVSTGNQLSSVKALLADGSRRVWIGWDRGGLWLWDDGRLTNFTERAGLPGSVRIRALFQTSAGTLWIGTRDGLFRSGPEGNRRFGREDGLPATNVGALHEDRLGHLWVGTEGGGLARWEEGRFRASPMDSGAGGGSVWGFLEDQRGALWIYGTHGLFRRLDGRWTTVTRRQGLFDDINNQMFEDRSGWFWLGCNRGIYRVRSDDLHGVADGRLSTVGCVQFGVADGLPVAETNGENQPAGCVDAEGGLWFPTPAGVVRVDPVRVAGNEVEPGLVIEEVRAGPLMLASIGGPNPELVGPGSGVVEVPPGAADVVEIQFTANSLAAPERVRFRHRLSGYQDEWAEAGTRRTALYTNLRPGRYRFEVTACNNHGVWTTRPAAFEFVLRPHWHQTRAFLVLLTSGFVGAMLGAHRLRLRFVKRRLALEGELGLARERERIARDMHDDVGASLTQIGFLTELARRSEPAAMSPVLEQIAEASRESAQAMDEIVWAVNPRNDRLEALAGYICQYAREYLESTGLRCRLEVPDQLPDRAVPSDVRHHLLMILKESIGNVVRHADATEVRVGFWIEAGLLHLTVADDGRGMEEGAAGRAGGGNGLKNLHQRAASMGGQCTVLSRPGEGTRIEVVVDPGTGARGQDPTFVGLPTGKPGV